MLKKTIRYAKMHYSNLKFFKYVNDAKQTWSTINEVLGKCKNKREFPKYFLMNNEKITGNDNIASNFNSYFANIGPELSSKLKINCQKTVDSFLIQSISTSFKFELTDSDSVKKTVLKLKPKTSTGFDNLSTLLLKRIIDYILVPLTLILNQSLCTGIFPNNLKVAKVIPIYKKGDIHDFGNYRPISLLPALSKVFERIVFIQLYDYFVKK